MTERSAPLVSVVMPAYQAQSFVRRAIESVKAQTFADWELVVIDDGSTDATADILIELERSDARIVALALKENSGAARARNAALKVSRGRFIAFLDSDDCWKPDKLKLQLGEMQKRGVALSFTDYRIVDTHRRVRHRSPPPAVAYDELLLSNVIGCSTAIYDRDQLGTCFFPDIRLRQDFGLWLSILRRIPAAYCCGGALTDRYLRPNSASANKLVALAATWKLYRSIERLPLLAAATCLASQAIGGIRRSL